MRATRLVACVAVATLGLVAGCSGGPTGGGELECSIPSQEIVSGGVARDGISFDEPE